MDKNFIFETNFWKVFLAEDQTYLGYSVVVLKRESCGDLAEVSEEEFLDFLQIVKRFEESLRKSFEATMFNWTCLMNNAYQVTPAKPHVHWHVKSRYDHGVEYSGEMFVDPNFGHHYALLKDCDRSVTDEMRHEIIKRIQDNLPL